VPELSLVLVSIRYLSFLFVSRLITSKSIAIH
jgi:hypothetical protein